MTFFRNFVRKMSGENSHCNEENTVKMIQNLISSLLSALLFSGTNCFFRDENIKDGTPGRSTPTGSKDVNQEPEYLAIRCERLQFDSFLFIFQYVSIEGFENSNARAIVVKGINVLLTLLQV